MHYTIVYTIVYIRISIYRDKNMPYGKVNHYNTGMPNNLFFVFVQKMQIRNAIFLPLRPTIYSGIDKF